jgi:hypothetical protein
LKSNLEDEKFIEFIQKKAQNLIEKKLKSPLPLSHQINIKHFLPSSTKAIKPRLIVLGDNS